MAKSEDPEACGTGCGCQCDTVDADDALETEREAREAREARAERKNDLTARAVRRECKRLLEEASDAAGASAGVGGSAMVVLMGALGALGLYVRHGEDPIAALLSVADPSRARSAGRIAGWLQVERERERLAEAYRQETHAIWDRLIATQDARAIFEREHPPDV